MVADFLVAMYERPSLVRGCTTTADFANPGNHGAVRFFLYRRAARRLNYQVERVPLPFELEVIIKALFMGDGPTSWTTFVPQRVAYHEQSLSRAAGGH